MKKKINKYVISIIIAVSVLVGIVAVKIGFNISDETASVLLLAIFLPLAIFNLFWAFKKRK
ncbi:MAG: hypothetical protein P9M07_02645 [Candidatus Aceula meridiana]|nr:hypothetical protein [Candidatus Aceula meridiana]